MLFIICATIIIRDTSNSDGETDEDVRMTTLFRERQCFDLEDFSAWYRLTRTEIKRLLGFIGDVLDSKTARNYELSPLLKVLLALRFYATEGVLRLIGDAHEVSERSACGAALEVTNVINVRLFQQMSRYNINR